MPMGEGATIGADLTLRAPGRLPRPGQPLPELATELASIDDRMPVILDSGNEALCLDPEVTDPLGVLPCLRPYPAEAVGSYAVAPLVSSVRHPA